MKKIREAVEWQTSQYEKNKRKDIIKLEEVSKEAMRVFDQARHLVFNFLKKQGVDINTLDIDKFNVYVTEIETEETASYDVIYDEIYINKSDLANEKILKRTFIHEIFHKLSASGNYLSQYAQKDNEFINKIKSGYSSKYGLIEATPEFTRTKGRKLFEAFNEGVTELLTHLSLPDNEKIRLQATPYSMEVAMVSAIIVNAYGHAGMKEFIENYFSGKMLHLRKIEKYYGKKSLWLLAKTQTKSFYKDLYGNDKKSLEEVYENRNSAIEFFTTKDKSRREEMRNKLGIAEN